MALIVFSSYNFGQKNKKVAFTQANNYFVSNTVSEGMLVFPKITSEKEFNKLFGKAPIMGKKGQPTPIDFSKQYVIAVIDELSYTHEGFNPVSLTKNADKITLTFSKKDVSEGSAQFRRYIILIVDKKNEGEVEFQDQNGTTYLPYTIGNRYFVKNTIENKEQLLNPITTEEEFEKYFGMATVMGEDGQPTPIDFNKQFVIAHINESSNDPVNYSFKLTSKDGISTLTYNKNGGSPGDSYRYCAILIVDKKYGEKVTVVKK